MCRFAEKPKLEMEELAKFLEYHVEVDPEKAEELDQTKTGATLSSKLT